MPENPGPRNQRRYLVTGGLGYAGAWVASRLAAGGHEVFVLSRGTDKPGLRPNPATENEIGAGEGGAPLPYGLIRSDLAEQSPAEIAALLPEKLDGVAHAASFNEAFEPGYGKKALATNTLGTRNLLEALTLQGEWSGSPLPLVLYFSTFHVYGASYGHITENSPLEPRNDYAVTHLFGEEYCRMYARTKGIPHIVVRPSNGYGAPKTAASTKWYLLLNDLCRAAFSDGWLVLRSDPAILRVFVWLGDVAAAVEALLERSDLAGRVFNISSGTSLSLGDVAGRVAAEASRFFNKDVPLIMERPSASPAAAQELVVDNSAVRSALNITFHNRMEREIHALFSLLAEAQASGLA